MRNAFVFCLLMFCPHDSFADSSLAKVTYFEQGWSASEREEFYYTPQGSHLIPADWFAVLERADGQGKFSDPNYLSQFGFLASNGASQANPGAYPVGFSVDTQANQIGLTCAACHTAEVELGGEVLRIDGAPAHLDVDAFYQSLAQAVSLTLVEAERFKRFAVALKVTDETSIKELKAKFTAFNLHITSDAIVRKASVEAGFGRVDALTQIANALAVRDQVLPTNIYPVETPTSYPPLWLTPQLEYVQWNPIAASPIGRNFGEVLGVYGNTNLAPDAGKDAYKSSANLENLHQLEQLVSTLQPPEWDPSRMGEIDADIAANGKTLFQDHCATCHNIAPYTLTDPAKNYFKKTFIKIGRVNFREVGTDPAYVENFVTRRIMTNATTAPLFQGNSIVPGPAFTEYTVAASLKRAIKEASLSEEATFAVNGFRYGTGDDGKPTPYTPPSLTDLKASPLAGVWATGPYLHNGSVPTIYELLSPVQERRTVFWTGGRSLDLEKLGYQSSEAPGLFRFDTGLRGNGNGGHLYPKKSLRHDERVAIIEYLKTQ